jgi:hypothetical protein
MNINSIDYYRHDALRTEVGPIMEIKKYITEEINKGKQVIEFDKQDQPVNLYINNINRALKDLGYTDKYSLSVLDAVIQIKIQG